MVNVEKKLKKKKKKFAKMKIQRVYTIF